MSVSGCTHSDSGLAIREHVSVHPCTHQPSVICSPTSRRGRSSPMQSNPEGPHHPPRPQHPPVALSSLPHFSMPRGDHRLDPDDSLRAECLTWLDRQGNAVDKDAREAFERLDVRSMLAVMVDGPTRIVRSAQLIGRITRALRCRDGRDPAGHLGWWGRKHRGRPQQRHASPDVAQEKVARPPSVPPPPHLLSPVNSPHWDAPWREAATATAAVGPAASTAAAAADAAAPQPRPRRGWRLH